jgi:cytochrome b561
VEKLRERYSLPAIGLHWIIFALVFCGWALGTYVSELPFSPEKLRYISWHKWIGVTVFMLAVARLAWRIYRPAPPLPESMPAWQRRAASTVHAALYVLLIVIPLTGWLFSSAAGVPTVWLGIVQLPDLLQKDKALADALRLVHVSLNWTLLVLVIGHAAYALKHHFVDRDEVLARMMPAVRPRPRSGS